MSHQLIGDISWEEMECSHTRATLLQLILGSPTQKPVFLLKGGVPTTQHTLLKSGPLHRVNPKPGSPMLLVGWGGCAHFTMPNPRFRSPKSSTAQGRGCLVLPCALGGEGWGRGILRHQHISKGTTGSADTAALSPWPNDGKHLSVGWRRAHNTFLVLLHDRGRWRSYFHGKAVGSPEGVAVSDDESPRLPVLQQCNRWRREQETSEPA